MWRHPKDMGVTEVKAFLTHLAAMENVSASTQNQAFNAKCSILKRTSAFSLFNTQILTFDACRSPARSLPYDDKIKYPGATTSAAAPLTTGWCVRGR